MSFVAVLSIIGLTFTGCVTEEENFSPTASFTVNPNTGNTETVFVFDASGSADPEDPTDNLLIRWDFNNDGELETEWMKMELLLGMEQSEVDLEWGWRGTDEGKKLKSTSGWNEGGDGTNTIGYNGLPGGLRDHWGDFINIGFYGGWWTSTEIGLNHAWMRGLIGKSTDKDKVARGDGQKVAGRSVRCIRD